MTAIEQLRESLKKKDITGAKAVLDRFDSESHKSRLSILGLIALEEDHTAWDLLDHMTRVEIRPGDVRERWIQLIADKAHLNFNFSFIFYKAAHRTKIEEALPLMRHILTRETDPGLLEGTIRAAGINLIHDLEKDIAEYIYFDNQELKAVAIQALERMGSAGSLALLEEAAATVKCDRAMLDAVKLLKNRKLESDQASRKKPAEEKPSPAKASAPPPSLSALNRELKSRDPDIRFKALGQMAELEEEALPILMENLKTGSHDTMVISLDLISRLAPEHLVGEIFALLLEKGSEASIRFAIYEALGAYPGLESAAPVLNGLDHPADHIRLAAIRILNKNFTDLVSAEIKARIESGTREGKKLVESILDAHAGTIMDALKVSDAFTYNASNYLAGRASIPCLEYYILQLNRRGLKSTAKKYQDMVNARSLSQATTALVVSSSETVQRVHEKHLSNAGYRPQSYFSTQEAFEKASETSPGLILADLFLDTMTGLDFAHELRELYSPGDLPIILSTRQKDFSWTGLEKRLTREGVQRLMIFPEVQAKRI